MLPLWCCLDPHPDFAWVYFRPLLGNSRISTGLYVKFKNKLPILVHILNPINRGSDNTRVIPGIRVLINKRQHEIHGGV